MPAGGRHLQDGYELTAVGVEHIALDTVQNAFHIDGASLVAGSTGTAGPDYFEITRGAVNILNTAYNATDLRATIYSGAINGFDISPDPGIFPDRATISVAVDKLLFLRQDRIRTVLQTGFFAWDSTLTLDFVNASLGGFITLSGIAEFSQPTSLFGMGNGLLFSGMFKNVNGEANNMGPVFLFAANIQIQADGASITQSQARIFLDNATYSVANAGVLTGGAPGHNSLWSTVRVNAGVTLALRRGVFIDDVNALGGGTITTQVGVDIADLDFAGTNIGIRCIMDTGTFIEHTGTTPARFGGAIQLSAGGGAADWEITHLVANIATLGAGDSLRIPDRLFMGAAGSILLSEGAANRLDLATGDSFRIINGALEHQAGTVGLFGAAPVTQPADIGAMTLPPAAGVPNNTLVDVPAVNGSGATTAQEAAINDNFADLGDQINDIRTLVFQALGLTA